MIVEILKENLQKIATDQSRIAGQRFFKEDVIIMGVKSSDLRKLSKNLYSQVKEKSKHELFEICTSLWQTNVMELCFVACDWTQKRKKEFVKEDFEIFENWVENYISNWATCDTFCNHTMGDIIIQYPDLLPKLMTWTKSDNRWVRRAAAVSLIVPARKALFIDHILNIADCLLLDNDDMVQKGYGDRKSVV